MLAFFHQLIENLKTSPARKNRIVLICTILSFLINIAIWTLLFLKFRPIALANPEKTTLPLHYNIYWGIDLFGQWYQIFIIPAIGLAVWLMNFVFSIFLYSKKMLATYFFTFSSVIMQILLFVSTSLIILINI